VSSARYYRELRQTLKAQGICTRCRVRAAEFKHTKCTQCLEDTRLHYYKQKAKISTELSLAQN